MALRAGAQLFNMEFMQQGLATTWPNQAIVMLYEMDEPYRLFNKEGQAFLHNYLPEGITLAEACKMKAAHWPVSCRDSALYLDRAIKAEAMAGRGTEHDAIFLDLSHAERGFLPELFPDFMASKGMDIQNDMIQVQIHHHTSNGGIRIDEDAQSSVRGLFAVGEVAGWQGADRLGGTMLGGSQVFGWRAGRKAAEVATSGKHHTPAKAYLDNLFAPVGDLKKSAGSSSISVIHKELQRKMWQLLIVDKDAESLKLATEFVASQREQLNEDLGIKAKFDVVLATEQRNLLDVADIITRAADMRKESRGSHIRTDFPDRDDDNWLTNIFVHYESGKMRLNKKWVCEDCGWTDMPGDVRITPWG